MTNKKLKIAVLMGGVSSEREISLSTGQAVFEALEKLGYDASKVFYNDTMEKCINDLQNSDIVFIALHGGDGENGEVQKILDIHGIFYTGSGPESSALCMDKNLSKKKVKNAGILTPSWQMVDHLKDFKQIDVEAYPVIVKPNDQGSTVGLTIAHDLFDLEKGIEKALVHSTSVMVENYITGREMTVTILDDMAYPVVEIIPSHELYDYECKYSPGMSNYVCPAEIDSNLTERLMRESLAIHRLLDCRDYSRVDFRIDDNNEPWFLEVNTLPGMTATSLVPKSVRAAGLSFENLIDTIVLEAVKRWQ